MWIINAFGLTAGYGDNFSDMGKTYKYLDALGTAKAVEFVNGTGNNRFSPEKPITRQEVLTIMVKALKPTGKDVLLGTTEDIRKFEDAAYDSAAAIGGSGLFTAAGDRLNSAAAVTRAEAAQVLYKLYKLKLN